MKKETAPVSEPGRPRRVEVTAENIGALLDAALASGRPLEIELADEAGLPWPPDVRGGRGARRREKARHVVTPGQSIRDGGTDEPL